MILPPDLHSHWRFPGHDGVFEVVELFKHNGSQWFRLRCGDAEFTADLKWFDGRAIEVRA